MQPTIKLTNAQIAFYHREGYLSIEAITTPEEVAWLREIYDRLFAQRAGREEGNQFDLAGAETPWHQDEAYWDTDLEYNEISVWIPLQEATPENGCMYFIPRSHEMEVRPHHPINHDPRIHGLESDAVDASQAVACALPPGGATFHGPRMLHYTPPNRSPIPRRAYILGFGTTAKKRATSRDFYWNRQKTTAREERAQRAQHQMNEK